MERLKLKWNKALKKYFYDFFKVNFARFMFILIFHLTFDYMTLSYLGHNTPRFSEDYILSGGTVGNGTMYTPLEQYGKSVSRIHKWRSQPYCYFMQHPVATHWVMQGNFF
jgi:hypothetical protein